MTDEAALLAAILAHPDEDTPRLMYADWLDEHGRPERAEFIRIQCDPSADEAAEERAEELEERNRIKWLAGLPQFPLARWEFRRGFPEFLDAPGRQFLARDHAFARVLWLRFLSLHELDNSTVREFCNRRWQAQWVELDLQALRYDAYGEPADTGPAVEAIANCPQAAQLRRLNLSLFELSEEAVDALATSPHLRQLSRLQFFGDGDESLLAPLRERFGDRLVIG
jgi:uncharacterized protein (TIGR02996 family)